MPDRKITLLSNPTTKNQGFQLIVNRFDERKVMLWGGFLFMVLGRIMCIPWGPDPPIIAEIDREYA